MNRIADCAVYRVREKRVQQLKTRKKLRFERLQTQNVNSLTRCLHVFAAGYITGCTTAFVWTQPVVRPVRWTCRWVQPSGAWASSQDAYDIIRLTRSVDSRQCGAFGRNLKKNILVSLFTFTLDNIWSWRMTKFRSITKLYKNLLYLFIHYMMESISSNRLYNRLHNQLYNRL